MIRMVAVMGALWAFREIGDLVCYFVIRTLTLCGFAGVAGIQECHDKHDSYERSNGEDDRDGGFCLFPHDGDTT